jgi:hypothetical protein
MAFGTLKFDTLTTSDTVNTSTEKSINTSYVFNGVAKAWHLSSDAAVLQDSFNISGGVDNGTGDYTFSFSNSMASVNYSAPHITSQNADNMMHVHTRAVGSFQVNNVNDEAAARDANTAGTIHGDLA